jgi:hypothetical protein
MVPLTTALMSLAPPAPMPVPGPPPVTVTLAVRLPGPVKVMAGLVFGLAKAPVASTSNKGVVPEVQR